MGEQKRLFSSLSRRPPLLCALLCHGDSKHLRAASQAREKSKPPRSQALAHAQADLVQPASQRPASADGTSPLGQRQERRLECILGIMSIADQSAAEAQD